MNGSTAPLAFTGDLLLFAYVLGLMRFFTVLAALDTGSSFEGMGASREVFFSALAEPALLLGLATVARRTGALSLSELLAQHRRRLLSLCLCWPLWVLFFYVKMPASPLMIPPRILS